MIGLRFQLRPDEMAGRTAADCGELHQRKKSPVPAKLKQNQRKIIGIDPGLASTGIGVIEGMGTKVKTFTFGSIRTAKSLGLAKRLDCIFSELIDILKAEKPDLMVVEDVFSLEKYPTSGIMLGKVTGVVLLAGCRSNMPITEIPVRLAKQVLTGNGNASKAQLEKSVRHYLNIIEPIRPYHASDALALAMIGLFRYNQYFGNTRGQSMDMNRI